MPLQEIQSSLVEFLLQQFPAARSSGWKPNDSLLEQGIVDSMGILEIVTFVEKRFGIQLADEELVADHFESVPALAKMISDKMRPEELCKS